MRVTTEVGTQLNAQILSCLADDVVWDLYGHKTAPGQGRL